MFAPRGLTSMREMSSRVPFCTTRNVSGKEYSQALLSRLLQQQEAPSASATAASLALIALDPSVPSASGAGAGSDDEHGEDLEDSDGHRG